MSETSFFFMLALAAAVFYSATMLADGRVGRSHGAGRSHGRSHGHAKAGTHRHGRNLVALLSINSVILFAGGVGVGGFFASLASWPTLWALAVGAGVGASLAVLDAAVLGALVRRQASSTVRMLDYVGTRGTVEVSITAGGLGRVRCDRDGRSARLLARSADGDLAAHTVVDITAIENGIAIVSPIESDPTSRWRQ